MACPYALWQFIYLQKAQRAVHFEDSNCHVRDAADPVLAKRTHQLVHGDTFFLEVIQNELPVMNQQRW